MKARSPNHWTARESPLWTFHEQKFYIDEVWLIRFCACVVISFCVFSERPAGLHAQHLFLRVLPAPFWPDRCGPGPSPPALVWGAHLTRVMQRLESPLSLGAPGLFSKTPKTLGSWVQGSSWLLCWSRLPRLPEDKSRNDLNISWFYTGIFNSNLKMQIIVYFSISFLFDWDPWLLMTCIRWLLYLVLLVSK